MNKYTMKITYWRRVLVKQERKPVDSVVEIQCKSSQKQINYTEVSRLARNVWQTSMYNI